MGRDVVSRIETSCAELIAVGGKMAGNVRILAQAMTALTYNYYVPLRSLIFIFYS